MSTPDTTAVPTTDVPLPPAPHAWLSAHSRPWPAPPEGLPTSLRSARVVGIATAVRSARESVHATRTLVGALLDVGFRVVMIEGVDAVASHLDHHLQTGEGDPAALLARGQGFVRNLEHLDLVRSLRRWNAAHPDDPVSVVDDRWAPAPAAPGSLHEVEEMLAERDLAWCRNTGQRVVHCGGTAHVIAGDPRTVPSDQTHVNAGGRLRRALGTGYAVVALTVGSGRAPFLVPSPPADFLENALVGIDDAPRLLDLSALDEDGDATPAEVRRWLDAPLRTRMIGPVYDASCDHEARVDAGPVRDTIDAAVHLPTITPVTPLR